VLRMVIVDDDGGMRLVGRMLAEQEGYVVAGEAETGEQGVRLVARTAPDCVLMDYRLPGLDGAQATRLVHEARAETIVIGWTSSPEDSVAEDFRAAGAFACVDKDDLQALRAAIRGAGSRAGARIEPA
jgi:CheY-like chemotaxis protein